MVEIGLDVLSILSMYYHYFAIISPRKLEFPSPKMLCDKLVEIGPVVLAKMMKMWNVYYNAKNDDNDDKNDDDGQRTNFDQKI